MKQEIVVVNTHNSISRRIVYYAILFSLLFNLFALLMIMLLVHRHNEFTFSWPETTSAQQNQQQKDNTYQFDPISYGNQRSNPDVSFVTEPPSPEQKEQEPTQDIAPEQALENPPIEAPEPSVHEQIDANNEINTKVEEETKQEEPMEETSEEQDVQHEPAPNSIIESKIYAQTHPQITTRPQLRSSSTASRSFEKYRKPATPRPEEVGNTPRKPSLADITQSYIQHVRREEFRADQQSNRQPQTNTAYAPHIDGKNFAFQVYSSKVANCIQQAARLQKNLIYAEKSFNTQSLVSLYLDRDGKLLRVTFAPPFEEKDISTAIETIMKRVGLFPPLPKSLESDSIVLTFPLNVRGEKGFGHYALSFGA